MSGFQRLNSGDNVDTGSRKVTEVGGKRCRAVGSD